ncbi:expressed unknown protein [Seminavis robusta]|uniref:Uncharacterized protein n=1 Tax=Seminavis robusta TaxID=568900 RepID=A0A9N8DBG6_9STRA|nr:expressed unknown protein [Seminavis robusta]|eukprot:Sro7_g006380.1 n/a (500) ;mRNA; f:253999-255498
MVKLLSTSPLKESRASDSKGLKLRHSVFLFGLLLVAAQLAVDHGATIAFSTAYTGNWGISEQSTLTAANGTTSTSTASTSTTTTSTTNNDNDLQKQVLSLQQQLDSALKKEANSQRELESVKQQLEKLGKLEKLPAGTASSTSANGANGAIAAVDKSKFPFARPPAKREFQEPYDRVVVATKIHGPHQFLLIRQMLCLFTFAYNNRMKYDVIVFTTDPLPEEDVKHLQDLGAPAKVSVVLDSPGLHEMIDNLDPHRKKRFLDRCGANKTTDLDWFSNCWEHSGITSRLAYNWQAEFRSLHVWNHPAMMPYKYMMWLDSDAFAGEIWTRDPIAYFIENDLVMFFDNFGQGTTRGALQENRERFEQAFNKTIRNVRIHEGHLAADPGVGAIQQIHGFFHITNLEWFRTEPVMKWMRILIGEEFLTRRFCDQMAVTGATAVLAPERSWDMRSHAIKLNVFHNSRWDGKEQTKGHFKRYWNEQGGKDKFPPEAATTCTIAAAQ